MQRNEIGAQMQIDFSCLGQVCHFLRRIRRPAESLIAVYQCDFFCDVREMNCPIQSRVAPAGDHQFLVAESFGVFHHIEYTLALELFQLIKCRLARFERTKSACDDDYFCMDGALVRSLEYKTPVV